jgi:hypothetical protein
MRWFGVLVLILPFCLGCIFALQDTNIVIDDWTSYDTLPETQLYGPAKVENGNLVRILSCLLFFNYFSLNTQFTTKFVSNSIILCLR